MSTPLTRRRFLSVCAVAGTLSALPLSNILASVPLNRWNGILLGANVSITLAHPDKKEADRLFGLCVTEIKRLENIFTLYDSYSELSRLNANGLLQNPSAAMIDVLEQRFCEPKGAIECRQGPVFKVAHGYFCSATSDHSL